MRRSMLVTPRARVPSVLVAALLLSACAPVDGDAPDADETPPVDDSIEIMEGPARASWSDRRAVRVDEVAFEEGRLEIAATVAVTAGDGVAIAPDDVRIVTNTGIELPTDGIQELTIPGGGVADLVVAVDDLPADVARVGVEFLGADLAIDVPEEGRTHRWEPAPLRQVGFADALVRDEETMAFVPFTFRTEGLISELTFMATTRIGTGPELCTFRNTNECHLIDSSGRTYPRLGSGYAFSEVDGSRVYGTLRFLGPIPPGETEFELVLEGSSGFLTVPDPRLEYSFTLPTAEESSLSVAASSNRPDPFDVGTTLGGENLSIQLKELSFHEDRIQLEVTATASDLASWEIDGGGDSALYDTSGYGHPLADPAGGEELVVGAGDSIDATLVFLTPLDVSADKLHLALDVGRDVILEHTIDLADAGEGGPADEEDDADGDEGT